MIIKLYFLWITCLVVGLIAAFSGLISTAFFNSMYSNVCLGTLLLVDIVMNFTKYLFPSIDKESLENLVEQLKKLPLDERQP
jgi:hypothetical protein